MEQLVLLPIMFYAALSWMLGLGWIYVCVRKAVVIDIGWSSLIWALGLLSTLCWGGPSAVSIYVTRVAIPIWAMHHILLAYVDSRDEKGRPEAQDRAIGVLGNVLTVLGFAVAAPILMSPLLLSMSHHSTWLPSDTAALTCVAVGLSGKIVFDWWLARNTNASFSTRTYSVSTACGILFWFGHALFLLPLLGDDSFFGQDSLIVRLALLVASPVVYALTVATLNWLRSNRPVL